VTRKVLEILDKHKRILGIVSRGGALLARWIKKNKKENPFYENFPLVLKIAKKYNLTLSLGDGLRPGAIGDATDKAQIGELKILGKLVKEARKEGVSIIVEGPGHIPINQIKENVELEKKYCNNAPFYVLGPLVCDIAPGYDHITSAIGGALAAMYGADFLCYVTPAEHLSLPTVSDVQLGVIASKIAAHSADIARGKKSAQKLDLELSKARKNLNWTKQIKLSIDPQTADKYHKKQKLRKRKSFCSMCGEFCAYKVSGKVGVK
jgi:phosphomethylpyrimidine synthase